MKKYDFLIIGNGITGNFLAYHFFKLNPELNIGLYFDGEKKPASELNAGFFTMGSWTFLKKLMQEKPWVIEILRENVESVKKLGKNLGLSLFEKGSLTILDQMLLESDKKLIDQFEFINHEGTWGKIKGVMNEIDFSSDPNQLLKSLRKLNLNNGVDYVEQKIQSEEQVLERADCVLYAVNGYGAELNQQLKKIITPQRAQIQEVQLPHSLGVSPNIYYPEKRIYYRIVEDRLVIGGLRTLDEISEQTSVCGVNDKIQSALLKYAVKVLSENFKLKESQLKINRQWSGIMGFTDSELPRVNKLQDNVFSIGGFSGHGNGFSFWLSRELVYFLLNQHKLSTHFGHFFLK